MLQCDPAAIMSHFSIPSTDGARTPDEVELLKEKEKLNKAFSAPVSGGIWAAPHTSAKQGGTNGSALTDTPLTTAPNSPIMYVNSQTFDVRWG